MLDYISNLCGLLGSVVLAIPAYRLSIFLHKIEQLKIDSKNKIEQFSDDHNRLRDSLIGIMEKQTSSWNKKDHYLLVFGFILLALSFIVSLVSNYLSHLPVH